MLNSPTFIPMKAFDYLGLSKWVANLTFFFRPLGVAGLLKAIEGLILGWGRGGGPYLLMELIDFLNLFLMSKPKTISSINKCRKIKVVLLSKSSILLIWLIKGLFFLFTALFHIFFVPLFENLFVDILGTFDLFDDQTLFLCRGFNLIAQIQVFQHIEVGQDVIVVVYCYFFYVFLFRLHKL